MDRSAHFESAAALKYHTPDTWHDIPHDIPPSRIILTLGRPVLNANSTSLMPNAKRKRSRSLWYDSAWDRTRNHLSQSGDKKKKKKKKKKKRSGLPLTAFKDFMTITYS